MTVGEKYEVYINPEIMQQRVRYGSINVLKMKSMNLWGNLFLRYKKPTYFNFLFFSKLLSMQMRKKLVVMVKGTVVISFIMPLTVFIIFYHK